MFIGNVTSSKESQPWSRPLDLINWPAWKIPGRWLLSRSHEGLESWWDHQCRQVWWSFDRQEGGLRQSTNPSHLDQRKKSPSQCEYRIRESNRPGQANPESTDCKHGKKAHSRYQLTLNVCIGAGDCVPCSSCNIGGQILNRTET